MKKKEVCKKCGGIAPTGTAGICNECIYLEENKSLFVAIDKDFYELKNTFPPEKKEYPSGDTENKTF